MEASEKLGEEQLVIIGREGSEFGNDPEDIIGGQDASGTGPSRFPQDLMIRPNGDSLRALAQPHIPTSRVNSGIPAGRDEATRSVSKISGHTEKVQDKRVPWTKKIKRVFKPTGKALKKVMCVGGMEFKDEEVQSEKLEGKAEFREEMSMRGDSLGGHQRVSRSTSGLNEVRSRRMEPPHPEASDSPVNGAPLSARSTFELSQVTQLQSSDAHRVPAAFSQELKVDKVRWRRPRNRPSSDIPPVPSLPGQINLIVSDPAASASPIPSESGRERRRGRTDLNALDIQQLLASAIKTSRRRAMVEPPRIPAGTPDIADALSVARSARRQGILEFRHRDGMVEDPHSLDAPRTTAIAVVPAQVPLAVWGS
ncbi:hypothetical protein JAAARDRAFT_196471 [Jaapia argillacea MUCL 33604]|uniref:Uncharacterized protein n=1 Tax=Jaapia argillacea MUCL 33604 TaxID=933084 RepID=A0A067PTE6_9AGAM|nr:hypothetical protein JAAARDRAFT_196471 [Jaapia argillacea MUCL 33604]